MRHRLCIAAVLGFALVLGACTVHQTTPPAPTGPSGFASPVAVSPAPFVSFTVAPAKPAANAPALFNATRSCGGTDTGGNCNPASPRVITSFVWNFGDGTQASGPVVSHSFPLEQTFNVTLTVTNDNGVSAVGSQTVAVGPGLLPLPAFAFSPTSPVPGQTVFFNGSTSTPGAGHRIASYSWNFGDGTTASGLNVSHAYACAAVSCVFNVQLTVTDEAGQSATSAGTTVTVSTTPPTPPPPPAAVFTSSPAAPHVGTVVSFNASASSGTITTYTWDFGDGLANIVTTTAPTTSHSYSASGTFTVTLTVRDASGQKNTTTAALTILP